MYKSEKKAVKDNCSCNFCKRGKLSGGGRSLIYPYETVFELRSDSGGGMIVSICEDCLSQLANFIKFGTTPDLFNLTKWDVKAQYGSCNFCNKGTLNAEQNGIDYPYDTVQEICGVNGFKTEFCPDCAQELYKLNLSHQTRILGKRFDL